MLENKAIQVATSTVKDRFFSNLFVTTKKDGGYRPVINLKRLNKAIPYQHFQMEGLKNVQDLIEPMDYLIKLDLSDAFFSVPLHKDSRKLTSFRWKGTVYEFRVLCFGLSSAPRIFSKLLKIPLAFLRKLSIRVVIYLDDLILFGRSKEEAIAARDAAILVLTSLGFTINRKKSILSPTQCLTYLGIEVNSREMTFALPEEKIKNLLLSCQRLTSQSFQIKDLSSLVGKLIATMPAVSTALLQVRFLQRCLICALRNQEGDYEAPAFLNQDALTELKWWMLNLELRKGKPLSILPADLIIQSDAAGTGGWGAHCAGWRTGGQWKPEEKDLHINVKEIIAADLAIRTFAKWKNPRSIHLQIDNTAALAYIANQGGTKSLDLLTKAKEIWDFLSEKKIQLTVEWLPSLLNKEADEESRNVSDSSEWLLDPKVFHQVCLELNVAPTLDLFASRTSHLLPRYMSWKADPDAIAVNALAQNWSESDSQVYAFPPFCLIGKVLQKLKTQTSEMILICPFWPTQPFFSNLLEMAIKPPLRLPLKRNLLSNPQGEPHPLMSQGKNHLQLSAWLLSGNVTKQKSFRKSLSPSSLRVEDRALELITTESGTSSLAGVCKGKQIPFIAL